MYRQIEIFYSLSNTALVKHTHILLDTRSKQIEYSMGNCEAIKSTLLIYKIRLKLMQSLLKKEAAFELSHSVIQIYTITQ